MKERMIEYLQQKYNDVLMMAEEFGWNDPTVRRSYFGLIDCKMMVEALIGNSVELEVPENSTVWVKF